MPLRHKEIIGKNNARQCWCRTMNRGKAVFLNTPLLTIDASRTVWSVVTYLSGLETRSLQDWNITNVVHWPSKWVGWETFFYKTTGWRARETEIQCTCICSLINIKQPILHRTLEHILLSWSSCFRVLGLISRLSISIGCHVELKDNPANSNFSHPLWM